MPKPKFSEVFFTGAVADGTNPSGYDADDYDAGGNYLPYGAVIVSKLCDGCSRTYRIAGYKSLQHALSAARRLNNKLAKTDSRREYNAVVETWACHAVSQLAGN